MEHFPDGQFVWLRSRTADVYLHANEDGLGVSLRANRATLNAAWRVQHLFYEDETLVLLQGAAHGRYLATTEVPAPLGHLGFRVGQHDFNEPEALSIRWQAVTSEDGDDIMLLHASPMGPHFLAIGIMGNPMIHWVVLPIPLLPGPPQVLPIPQIPGYLSVRLGPNLEEDRRREVRCVRGDPDDGSVNENDWVTFQFSGRSVFNLRNELAQRLGLGEEVFTMCVRAGPYARLTPLVVDLPISNDRLDIVILMPGLPAIQEFQHPDVDAA